LRIWALLGPHAGDNNQVLALAGVLGRPFDEKRLAYNRLRHLRPHLLGARSISLTTESRRLIAGPPPDLTISTGIRSVPVIQALRRRSAGTMRTVHLGDPRIAVDRFDLVVPTPEYPAFDDGRAVPIPFALTRDRPVNPAARLAFDQNFPAPRQVLLIGGNSLYWTLHADDVRAAIDAAEGEGGSVIVVTSARTPTAIARTIDERLLRTAIPACRVGPAGTWPYPVVLAAAHSIRVSADSVAMVSDAIAADRFRGLIPVRASGARGAPIRLLEAMSSVKRARPRDLRRFWQTIDALPPNDRNAAAAAALKSAIAARVLAFVGKR
jgi:mitochondrial fission protein ELM1